MFIHEWFESELSEPVSQAFLPSGDFVSKLDEQAIQVRVGEALVIPLGVE